MLRTTTFALLAFLLPLQVTHAEDRSINLQLKGIPNETEEAITSVQIIDVATGTLLSTYRDTGSTEVSIDAPNTHLLLNTAFVSLAPPALYTATQGLTSQDSLDIQMSKAAVASKGIKNSYPDSPPEQGIAISYDPADFTVTGPDTFPGLERGLADIMSVDLGNNACENNGDNSYVYVITGNPKLADALHDELDLQQSPDFDEEYKVTPHLIRATHLMKGSFVYTENTFSVTLWLVEVETGRIVATSFATGDRDMESVLDSLTQATTKITKRVCAEKPWNGTLTATANTEQNIPNPDPKKPDAKITSSISVSCDLKGSDAECTASYSYSLSGDKVTFVEQGSGKATVGASAGFAGEKDFAVHIGGFSIKTTATLTNEGGSQTAEGSVNLGNWSGRGPAQGKSKSQAGSSKDRTVQVTWDVTQEGL